MAGGSNVQGGGPPGQFKKTITWEYKRWVCEPFIVELFQEINNERIPVNIDPKTVKIKDTRGWLEKDGDPVRGVDKKWQVPVRIKQEKLKELAPAGYNSESWKPPVFTIGPPKPDSSLPGRYLSTTLTVTVEVITAGELAGAVMGAGTGMGAIGVAVSGATPRNVVPSKPVEYVVQPVKPIWHVEQEKPVPLSGQGSEETVKITMSLPEGWDSGLAVTCSLPPNGAKKRGLEIISVNDNQSEPGNLKAELKIKNSILCMKIVKEISEDVTVEPFVLRISTKSEYLGTPLQEAIVNIQPVDVCLYLDKMPESRYPWTTRPVRIIRKDTNDVPRRSKLAAALEHCKEFNPDFKKIKWSLSDDLLLDEFKEANAELSTYIAPKEDKWTENGKPEVRDFTCLAGPDDEETEIDENLFSTVLLKSKITLKEPIGYGTIKIVLSPSGLPDAEHMDLINPDVLKNFHRVFCMTVDLQEILDKEGSE